MFRRFCQFPYCGDYDGLSPDPKGEQKAEDAECAEIRVESMNVFVNSKYHCPLDNSDDRSIVLSPGGEQASECKQAPEYIGERRPFGYQILDKFIYTNIYIPHRVLSPFKHWTFNSEVKPFDPSSYAFSSFRKHLMHHTDMYMLGNRYGVTKLKDMALYKCWRMLRSWPLFEVHETLPIIAATLTCTKPGDRLRELFAHFIASLSSAPPPWQLIHQPIPKTRPSITIWKSSEIPRCISRAVPRDRTRFHCCVEIAGISGCRMVRPYAFQDK